MNSNHIETLVLHAGIEPDPTTGAIMTPIFQTSTYVQAAPGDHKGYEYARTQNPTRDVLQKNLAALEGTNHGLCFSTGMGAVDACAKLLSPGDEVVSTNDLYGGTYRLFTKIFVQYGIKFHFVDMSDESAVRAVMNEKTKMVWVETPTNPLLRIIDIELMIASIFFDVSAGIRPSKASGVSVHFSFASAQSASMISISQPTHLPLASTARVPSGAFSALPTA